MWHEGFDLNKSYFWSYELKLAKGFVCIVDAHPCFQVFKSNIKPEGADLLVCLVNDLKKCRLDANGIRK